MTRRQLLHLLTAAPALAVTGCTAQSASSQQEKPLILRYAENQPEDYPTSKAAKAFAELVAQHTDGRVKVLVYSGAELGAEQSVIQQMQFGGVDFSRVSLSQLAEYEPELSVLQLPYLYSDAEQMWRCAGRQHRRRVSGHAGRDGLSGTFVVRRRCAQLLYPGKGDRAG